MALNSLLKGETDTANRAWKGYCMPWRNMDMTSLSDKATERRPMIIDALKNAPLYHGLGPGIAQALEFLMSDDLAELTAGRYDIEGDAGCHALISEYQTKPMREGIWEGHRKYTDVQCVLHGVEQMGWSGIDTVKSFADYDEEQDVEFFEGQGNFFVMSPKMFVIFGPQDVHMPGIALDGPCHVRKVVVKVPVVGDLSGEE